MITSGTIQLSLNFIDAATDEGWGVPTVPGVMPYPTVTILPGTGLNQANFQYRKKRNLASGVFEDLDINAGNIVDPYANIVSFTRVVVFAFYNPSAGSQFTIDSTIANGWRSAFNGILAIAPGGIVVFVNPQSNVATYRYVVTPATGDLIRVTNSGGGVAADYYTLIVGS